MAEATGEEEEVGFARRMGTRSRTALEVVVGLVGAAYMVVGGGGITTDLLFHKVCKYEMGLDDHICGNLNDEQFRDTQIAIQKRVNEFEIYRDWVGHSPPIFFGLIAGALSDQFGRKPLIFWPLVGSVLGSCVPLVFLPFVSSLPMEFMLLEEINGFFGGFAVFYVGQYSYGASVSSTADRSIVLSRYDGVSTLALIAGSALSTTVFKYLGFYGNYVIRLVVYMMALAYLVLVIEEPIQNRQKVGKFKAVELPSYFYRYIIKSVVDTAKTVFKRRPDNMRLAILVQVAVYASYKFSNASFDLTYLYMKLVFNAENTDYALFISVLKLLQGISLIVLMPVLARCLGLHDTLIVAVCTLTNATFILSSAFVDNKWAFMACKWGTFLRLCQYGAGRSLMTRSVEEHEMGKILSTYPIVSSFVPFVAGPAMRAIYQATMETFPSTYIVVAGALILLGSALNAWLYLAHRNHFREEEKGKKEEEDGEGEEEDGVEHKDKALETTKV